MGQGVRPGGRSPRDIILRYEIIVQYDLRPVGGHGIVKIPDDDLPFADGIPCAEITTQLKHHRIKDRKCDIEEKEEQEKDHGDAFFAASAVLVLFHLVRRIFRGPGTGNKEHTADNQDRNQQIDHIMESLLLCADDFREPSASVLVRNREEGRDDRRCRRRNAAPVYKITQKHKNASIKPLFFFICYPGIKKARKKSPAGNEFQQGG